MNRTELATRLSRVTGLSRADAERVIRALFDPDDGILASRLRVGEKVSIPGFGTFSIRQRAPRQGRNPHTGESIRIGPSVAVRFSPSKALKEAVPAKPDRPATRKRAARRAAPDTHRRASPAGGRPSAAEPPSSGAEPPDSGAGPPEAAAAGDASSDVRFTIRHPKEIGSDQWYTLLAYAHLPGAIGDVMEDSRVRLGDDADDYGRGKGQATTAIRRGADIVVVPELPGCRFNPRRGGFTWLKDWHRAEFEVQATPAEPGFAEGQAVNGRVAFYVGPVLVGEVKIWAHIAEADNGPRPEPEVESVTGDSYRRIFVSYAHQDAKIVDALERAYEALGDSYVRDVRTLRSGEEWNPALLRMIEQADLFQLCWSLAARQSKYVMQELRHAISQKRSGPFIRPTYWETPMPPPPPEIAQIHFARLELE